MCTNYPSLPQIDDYADPKSANCKKGFLLSLTPIPSVVHLLPTQYLFLLNQQTRLTPRCRSYIDVSLKGFLLSLTPIPPVVHLLPTQYPFLLNQ